MLESVAYSDSFLKVHAFACNVKIPPHNNGMKQFLKKIDHIVFLKKEKYTYEPAFSRDTYLILILLMWS